ncbi:MAG: transcription elongation factor GreA [Chloroflexota bacterium]|nr:MAG: transcription elongation factor GreA [Chloroflexota bacterium]
MASKNKPDSAPPNYSLGEAATQFLLTLSSEERLKSQQEVYKFVRWYGEKRPLMGLTIPEVANYTEQITSSTTEVVEKLGIPKTFLAYAHKQGWTKTNLSVHLKSKKTPPKLGSPIKRSSHKKVLLTTKGYADLKAELDTLKNKRPRIAEEIQKAASDKDFRENAPLEAAREQLGQVEGRIKELESTLKTATLLDEQQAGSREISFGDTVVLRDLASGEQVSYKLVDASEANAIKGKISVVSPMGRALLGRMQGQKIEVKAPAGIMHYQIEDIQHRLT